MEEEFDEIMKWYRRELAEQTAGARTEGLSEAKLMKRPHKHGTIRKLEFVTPGELHPLGTLVKRLLTSTSIMQIPLRCARCIPADASAINATPQRY